MSAYLRIKFQVFLNSSICYYNRFKLCNLLENSVFYRFSKTNKIKICHYLLKNALKYPTQKSKFVSSVLLTSSLFRSSDSTSKSSDILQIEADILYQESNFTELYKVLKQAMDGGNSKFQDPEIYWRLARAAKEMANLSHEDNEKAKAHTYEAFEYAKAGLELNSENWACNKWYGILLDLTARYEGTRKRIENSYQVREYLDKAYKLNPKDATTIHSLGVWCYEFAALPWYQEKIAAALFATPPKSTFEEALKYFLAAESVDPDFYAYNLLYLGKCYYQMSENDLARKYLHSCINQRGNSVDDQKAKEEARSLLKKIG